MDLLDDVLAFPLEVALAVLDILDTVVRQLPLPVAPVSLHYANASAAFDACYRQI